MDVKRFRILYSKVIAADETEKYTDIRVILDQLSLCLWLSGGTAAGTEKGQGTYSTARRLQEV